MSKRILMTVLLTSMLIVPLASGQATDAEIHSYTRGRLQRNQRRLRGELKRVTRRMEREINAGKARIATLQRRAQQSGSTADVAAVEAELERSVERAGGHAARLRQAAGAVTRGGRKGCGGGTGAPVRGDGASKRWPRWAAQPPMCPPRAPIATLSATSGVQPYSNGCRCRISIW